jgi:hypothetical protein
MFFPTVTVFRGTFLIPVFADPSTGNAFVGSFTLPAGKWQLVWTVSTLGGSATSATIVFADDGVVIDRSLPGDAVTLKDLRMVSPTQWAAGIDNRVQEVGGVVQYTLNLRSIGGTATVGFRFPHDPTIFISKDPIDPPV